MSAYSSNYNAPRFGPVLDVVNPGPGGHAVGVIQHRASDEKIAEVVADTNAWFERMQQRAREDHASGKWAHLHPVNRKTAG